MSLETTTVAVPVTRVTVLEDRASVRREGILDLSAGTHRVRIEGLAPVLVDKSLSVNGEGLTVGDTEIRRRRIHRSDEAGTEERRKLAEEARERRAQITELDGSATAIERELALMADAMVQGVREIGDDSAWGRDESERWQRDLATLAKEREHLAAELAEVRHDRKLRARELSDLEARIAELENPSTERRCTLEIALEVTAEKARLRVDYVVPCAAWRPVHRATLEEEGPLRFETEACVWQRTGEDWEDVELRVSTERLSAGAEPPRLVSDELRVRPRDQQVRVETREQEIEQIGTGEGPQLAKAQEVPGVDDGGKAVLRTVAGKVRVPGDGRPHRLPLGGFEAEAERGYVCAPELTAAVILRTRLRNDGKDAILAGPVELFRDSGPAGRTRVLYVSPGERFELGWGPEAALRVHREVSEEPPEKGMLSRWIATTKEVTVRVGHLGLDGVSYDVELIERVPVSEVDAVKVEVDGERTSEGKTPDSDGFLRWRERMKPGGKWKVTLRWTLSKKKDVVGI
jgi:uncharacterized protein (TIGR02231 family)